MLSYILTSRSPPCLLWQLWLLRKTKAVLLLLQLTSPVIHVAYLDILLEAKNALSPVALPHLLLIGIAVAVQKGKAKVDLGMGKAKANTTKSY